MEALFVSSRPKRMVTVFIFLCCAFVFLALEAIPAGAASGTPQWTVTSVSRPTNFKPGGKTGEDAYVVTITNTGGASSDGSPIVITDELPEGLSLDAEEASGEDQLAAEHHLARANFNCSLSSCTYTGVVVPDDVLIVTFPVDVSAGDGSSLTNVVHVSGGGAPDAAMPTPTTISNVGASFGISPGGAVTTLSTTQAGAHPDLTTAIAFNTVDSNGALAGAPKDTTDELPPGFAGDLVDTPSCTPSLFALDGCPIDTQIGVETATLHYPTGVERLRLTKPVYNLTPNPGELAKLGFFAATGIPAEGEVAVRPSDYGLKAVFHNVNESLAELDNVSLTVWGVPADPIHDPLRWHPPAGGGAQGEFGVSSSGSLPAPFLTNPTLCGNEALSANFSVSSWEQPNATNAPTPMEFGPMVGCDRLVMEPTLTAEATTTKAYSPTGLNLTMTIPQTYNNAEGLATSTLKRAVVTLPEGMTVNPSAGAGLVACTEAQYREEEAQIVPGKGCPNESKLGTVTIESPAIKELVKGSVFLAEPAPNGEVGRNPFDSLLALYVVARIPDRGLIVRAAGQVTPDPVTGRLVTTFDDLPPLPFSLLTFSFSQGATSPLVTPPDCGQYSVQAQLTPWSEPSASMMPEIPAFPITQAFDGGACPAGGLPPFAPQVLAGTANNTAGSYSSMYLRLIRGDGEQEITRFSSQLPSGLTANLTGVPFCSDANIELAKQRTGAAEEAEPSCPTASEIGHTLVGAGVGSLLAYAPGKIYLAGPYNGAPFSVVSITSAKVGPFDLGTVVVRLALKINPNTAIVTVDASASDPIPHIIKGIVVHVRDIRVYIDRPNFTLNPTSCERMTFSATVSGSGSNFASSADDVPVTVNDPFQATDCQNLKFKPIFKASTAGKTSRKNGASLSVKLEYPKAPQGSQSNIRSVKVDLPKQLPSRLSTLQKACPDFTFNANPASCPQASRVGQARAVTPILPVPLVGPAYFVSHGGAKFPELVIVLQGYGVTIDLRGETFIGEKTGITSSTFRSVPDQPVSTFELKLPQGPNSALAAKGSLCKSKLKLPTVFTAQNGFVIHQSTPIGVTGCSKQKPKKKPKTKVKSSKGKHGR
jgi:hypothetical protein